MATCPEFVEQLRDALNHLYDPDRLCRSPLAERFGVARRPDASSALQQILIEAIGSLQPPASTPTQSRAWRIHELLFYRYVQQHTVDMVADQLGVTIRHLRREQRAALEALAYRLQQQFGVRERVAAEPKAQPPSANVVSTELAWLRVAPPEPTDPQQALMAVSEVIGPLADLHQVRLETETAEALPALAVRALALNQVLLNLLSVAIPRGAGRRVSLTTQPRGGIVEFQVRCQPGRQLSPSAQDEAAKLEMARQLAELAGMRLQFAKGEGAFSATLSVPVVAQVTVLAIDDNADALHLYERYTAGTRYRLLGVRDPEQALALAAELAPQIIVLDVMMPGIDGWRVLAQLRQHPQIGHIPIIVCTILPQEDLALSLGASGFAHKPVTQQDFLGALDQQVGLLGPESG